MKKNYFKKIAAIVAAATLCTASVISVSAADSDFAYMLEDKTIAINEITNDVVTLDLTVKAPDGKVYDSFGGFAVVIETPDSIEYIGRKDLGNVVSTPDIKDEPTSMKFIMSGSNVELKNSTVVSQLQFKINSASVKAGDKVSVSFIATPGAMTSYTGNGDAADMDNAFNDTGFIEIAAVDETTTTEASTVAETSTTGADDTTAADTTATTAAGTTTSASTTTTKAVSQANSPKTGESTDGVAALAATMLAAAGAAVVLRKKKD